MNSIGIVCFVSDVQPIEYVHHVLTQCSLVMNIMSCSAVNTSICFDPCSVTAVPIASRRRVKIISSGHHNCVVELSNIWRWGCVFVFLEWGSSITSRCFKAHRDMRISDLPIVSLCAPLPGKTGRSDPSETTVVDVSRIYLCRSWQRTVLSVGETSNAYLTAFPGTEVTLALCG
jgi:hypothetical protein